MTSDSVGRLVVLSGGLLLAAGLLSSLGPKRPFWGRLPGDIAVDRGRFSLYAPIATMVVLSLGLTVVVNVFLWLWRR